MNTQDLIALLQRLDIDYDTDPEYVRGAINVVAEIDLRPGESISDRMKYFALSIDFDPARWRYER